MTTDALAALFRRLVLAAQQADALARPIEVGEILDTLVPYRAARRDGLINTNDDYLHAVLEMLAGERGYVFADDLMQDDLRSELSALNPDLGVLTTYRTAKVRISSTHANEVLSGDTSIDLRPPTPLSTPVIAAAVTPVLPVTPVAAPPVAAPPVAAPPVAAPTAPAPRPSAPIPTAPRGVSVPTPVVNVVLDESPADECPYCSRALPADRTLKYCPHCGLNLRIRRCAGCSAEMESEWKFCVTCGRSAP
jgi:hypothetical protein